MNTLPPCANRMVGSNQLMRGYLTQSFIAQNRLGGTSKHFILDRETYDQRKEKEDWPMSQSYFFSSQDPPTPRVGWRHECCWDDRIWANGSESLPWQSSGGHGCRRMVSALRPVNLHISQEVKLLSTVLVSPSALCLISTTFSDLPKKFVRGGHLFSMSFLL